MQAGSQGSVRDFVAMGDVDIRVIGADNQVLDSEVPVRQILEQLIARTGIPPFMLGLSWSSTERMSSQQADLMTSEIGAIRRSLDPIVERICETWLRLNGFGGSVKVNWAQIKLQDEVEQAKAEGWVATLFGRRRWVPELKSSNFNTRSFGERVALNAPIQGTAADIIKLAMVRVRDRLLADGLQGRLVLQVHDELIVECPEAEAEQVSALLQQEMENVARLAVPLLADTHCGKSWADAH